MSNDIIAKVPVGSDFSGAGLKPFEVVVPNSYPTPAQKEGSEPMPETTTVKRYPAPEEVCPL